MPPLSLRAAREPVGSVPARGPVAVCSVESRAKDFDRAPRCATMVDWLPPNGLHESRGASHDVYPSVKTERLDASLIYFLR